MKYNLTVSFNISKRTTTGVNYFGYPVLIYENQIRKLMQFFISLLLPESGCI